MSEIPTAAVMAQSRDRLSAERAFPIPTSDSTSTPTPQSLMKVPIEVRQKIWTYAMQDLPARFKVAPGTNLSMLVFYPGTLPSFTFLNHKFVVEIVLAWVCRTRFMFAGPYPTLHKLVKFLDQFDEGLRALRMIGVFKLPWEVPFFDMMDNYLIRKLGAPRSQI